jgi:hypothetical protein
MGCCACRNIYRMCRFLACFIHLRSYYLDFLGSIHTRENSIFRYDVLEDRKCVLKFNFWFFVENIALGESWITTLHQFWYLPLCFAVLYCDFRSEGLPARSWIYSCFINLGMSAFSYIHYMKVDTNGSSFAPSFSTPRNAPRLISETPLTSYLVSFADVAHEYLVNDASLIHEADSSGFIAFLTWRLLIESFLLNGFFFAFLKAFSYLLIERDSGKYKEKVK